MLYDFALVFNHDTTFLATKMAVAFRKVSAFNSSQDKCPLYVERLGHVFVANGITEEPSNLSFSHQCQQLQTIV